MKIEHFACQTEHPALVADWYVTHFGFTIKRAFDHPAVTRFLADESGQVMLEVYNNPTVKTPDYAGMDPLLLHIAFRCDCVPETLERLVNAGATRVSGPDQVNGDELAMLRDPWGLAIQLCNRGSPML